MPLHGARLPPRRCAITPKRVVIFPIRPARSTNTGGGSYGASKVFSCRIRVGIFVLCRKSGNQCQVHLSTISLPHMLDPTEISNASFRIKCTITPWLDQPEVEGGWEWVGFDIDFPDRGCLRIPAFALG